MRLEAAAIVIRERSLLEVLDLTLRFVVTVGRATYLRLVAALLLPALLACLAIAPYGAGWAWVAAFSLAELLEGAFTVAAGRTLFDPRVGARAVLAAYGRRFWTFFLATLQARLVAGLGLLTLVAAPFGLIRGFFVGEAALLEEAGAAAAVGRAARIAARDYAWAAGAWLLASTLRVAFVIGADMTGRALVGDLLQLGEPFESLWVAGHSPYALAGLFLATPVTATFRFLAYVDGRTRGDGWEVQVRFMALAGARP